MAATGFLIAILLSATVAVAFGSPAFPYATDHQRYEAEQQRWWPRLQQVAEEEHDQPSLKEQDLAPGALGAQLYYGQGGSDLVAESQQQRFCIPIPIPTAAGLLDIRICLPDINGCGLVSVRLGSIVNTRVETCRSGLKRFC